MTAARAATNVIPPQIAALEHDPRGLPMFFIVQPPEGRVFSFKVVNPLNQARCGKEKLCAICGQRLSYRFVFTGGIEAYERRMFGTGPMHRECFDYAFQVCPFLAGRYESKHREPTNPLYFKSKVQVAEHPDISVTYETRGIKRYGLYGDMVMFVPEAPTRLEFFDRNGQPLEVTT